FPVTRRLHGRSAEDETLQSAAASSRPVPVGVGFAFPAMPRVRRAAGLPTTDSTRTTLVRRPCRHSGKMTRAMKPGAPASFGTHLKALREAAGFTQEELATIAGLSVHAVSALERGHRRRPHVDTVRALSAALDLTGAARDALVGSARAAPATAPVDQWRDVSLPLALTMFLGRDADVQTLLLWL